MKHNYRYTVMTMIVIITIINYIDRGALSYAQASIIDEFNLDPKSWGGILGYFGYGYMFGSLFGGILVDKKGTKFVWILAAVFWSIFEIGTAFVGELSLTIFGGSAIIGFAVFRILFGLAEGPFFTTANRTMASWAAPSDRGFATAIGIVGAPIGAMLTAPVAVGMLMIMSWKMMLIILGLTGIVWALFWMRMFTNRPENHSKVTSAELAIIQSKDGMLENEVTIDESEEAKVPWYTFFRNPSLIWNAISYFCFMYICFLLLTWTPKYIQDVFDVELSSLWYFGMIPWIGACFTVLLGGKISDLLRAKTGNLRIARSGVSAVSYLLTAICFLIIPTLDSAWSVVIVIAIGNAFNYIPNSLHWAIITDTAPAKAGTFGGITHFIANIASILAPTLTGIIVVSSGYNFTFVAAAIAAAIGAIAMLFVKPGKVEPRKKHKLDAVVNE